MKKAKNIFFITVPSCIFLFLLCGCATTREYIVVPSSAKNLSRTQSAFLTTLIGWTNEDPYSLCNVGYGRSYTIADIDDQSSWYYDYYLGGFKGAVLPPGLHKIQVKALKSLNSNEFVHSYSTINKYFEPGNIYFVLCSYDMSRSNPQNIGIYGIREIPERPNHLTVDPERIEKQLLELYGDEFSSKWGAKK